MLAARSGLVVPPFAQSSRVEVLVGARLVPPSVPVRTVFVVGGCVPGHAFAVEGHGSGAGVPDAVARSCVALAARVGVGLLGVEFTQGPDRPWMFAGASPQPDLRLGGEELLDALAAALEA